MDLHHLWLFAAAYAAVMVLPGPGVTSLVSRVLARGNRGTPAFIAGFVAGSLCWFTVAATGLAALVDTFATVFVAVRYVGAAYLLFLAWKLWTAPARPMSPGDVATGNDVTLFLTGLSINLGNPKVIVFFLALLPTVVDLRALTLTGGAELAMSIAVIAGGVLSGYAILAGRARRVFTSPRAIRVVNRSSSAVMAGTAVTIALRR